MPSHQKPSRDGDELRPELDTGTRTDTGTWSLDERALLPGLTIAFHPDLDRVGERLLLPGLSAAAGGGETGQLVELSRLDPLFAQPGKRLARPLALRYLSRSPLLLLPGREPGGVAIDARRSRTPLAVDGRPVEGRVELSAEEVRRGAVLLLANRVVLILSLLDPTAGGEGSVGSGEEMIGASPPMVRLRREIARVADLSVPVLLRGETGSGKELVARALHRGSPRRRAPFLAVNLGAIPPNLAAAELFGAAKGAFTGADRDRPGYLQQADGGTLLLDEIGEAPPEVQVLLLRALENGEIQPVGGTRSRRVDVRLVAATDADLEAAVADGRFRAPLLHRLNAYVLRLPPLAERREDFGRLLAHFLRLESAALGDGLHAAEDAGWLPAPLIARLAGSRWSGNVRQLRNTVRRLVIVGRDRERLTLGQTMEHLLEELEGGAGHADGSTPRDATPLPQEAGPDAKGGSPPGSTGGYRPADEVSDQELAVALVAHRWRIKPAAADLGVSRSSLYDRIARSPRFHTAADLTRGQIEAALAESGGDLEAAVDALEVSRRALLRRIGQLGIELGE